MDEKEHQTQDEDNPFYEGGQSGQEQSKKKRQSKYFIRIVVSLVTIFTAIMMISLIGLSSEWKNRSIRNPRNDKMIGNMNGSEDAATEEEKDEQWKGHLTIYAPRWLPDGFYLQQCDYWEDGSNTEYFYYYTDEESKKRLSVNITECSESIESENLNVFTDMKTQSEYTIHGITHYISKDDNLIEASWVKKNQRYVISGNLTISETKQLIQSFYKKELLAAKLHPYITKAQAQEVLKIKEPKLQSFGLTLDQSSYEILPSKVTYTYYYGNFTMMISEYMGEIFSEFPYDAGQDNRFDESYTLNQTSIQIASTKDGYTAFWYSGSTAYRMDSSLSLTDIRRMIKLFFPEDAEDSGIHFSETQWKAQLQKYRSTVLFDLMKETDAQISIRDGEIICQYNYQGVGDRFAYLMAVDHTYCTLDDEEEKDPSCNTNTLVFKKGKVIYSLSGSDLTEKEINKIKMEL